MVDELQPKDQSKMSRLIYGHRIGKEARLMPSCCAIIFDDLKSKIILTKRSDNGRWCIPGGAMEAGESARDGCLREVMEETGLSVKLTKLIGIYTNPNYIIQYNDGNKIQAIGMCFEAKVIGGNLSTSPETTDIDFFTRNEIDKLDVVEDDLVLIKDGFADAPSAFIR